MFVEISSTVKKYNIIYADPPWSYKVWRDKSKEKRSAESHYHCMEKKEIQNLPISDITAKDCVLFLWATFPCLQEGLELIEKWGFAYKTCGFNWIKLNKKSKADFVGMGYYTRANAEICLLATKGKTLKRLSHAVRQIVFSPIEEHSKKPDDVRVRIVKLFGDLPRIELFARQEVDGWDCWGDEVEKRRTENEKVLCILST